MRDIKFRAWNTDEDRYVDGFSIRSDGVICSPWGKDKPEWILEEFTGLCDKNGRDIWEGDIVKTFSDKATESYKHMIQTVIWFRSSFVLKNIEDIDRNHNGSAYWWINDYLADVEVIGNIHENPEFIEVEHA